eukprot:m.23358 g.23358  ORF g.23358 m.23358 type:complete len:338 (-) comp4099_c0_seq1:161-1174(-)
MSGLGLVSYSSDSDSDSDSENLQGNVTEDSAALSRHTSTDDGKRRKRARIDTQQAKVESAPLQTRIALPKVSDLLKNEQRSSCKASARPPEAPGRAFSGVTGHWPTFVSAPLEHRPDGFEELVDRLQSLLGAALPDSAALAALPSLHVSLSRTAVLLQHQVAPFQRAASAALSSACVAPFEIVLQGPPRVYLNGAGTQAFLGLRAVPQSCEKLGIISAAADVALGEFGQAPYFEDREFHLSVLTWSAPLGAAQRVDPAAAAAAASASNSATITEARDAVQAAIAAPPAVPSPEYLTTLPLEALADAVAEADPDSLHWRLERVVVTSGNTRLAIPLCT